MKILDLMESVISEPRKELSKYAPKYPITHSITAVIPIFLLYIKSIISPQITPKAIPAGVFTYNPTNNINITNKLGIIPAIVKN